MQTDYIIVGQGLCGTLLSWELLKKGKKVIVIDEPQTYSAGKVASGLINPVTGKRIVKSWMIDELLLIAIDTYAALEQELNIDIIKRIDILEFHPSSEIKDTFAERSKQYPEYLVPDIDEATWQQLFHFYAGIGGVKECMLIDMRALQNGWRQKLVKDGILLEEKFDQAHCTIGAEKVVYKDIEAQKIIFCDGAAGLDNLYFSRLPFAINKGEVLIASIPDLPRKYVYKNSLKIAPWEDDLFWIGSSFEWTFNNVHPSENFRKKTEFQLKNWLKLPYKIEDHWASIRPATVDHKPFAGFHPLHPAVGILNGMGAKGCSQGPYFAASLASHLAHNTPLHREADIARFTKVLSKVM